MPHSHDEGERPEEIYAFADHLLRSMPPLATVQDQRQRGELVWLNYTAQIPIAKVDFNYTTDPGEWKDRRWATVAAESQGQHKFRATLPPGVTAYYFNLTDEHGLVVSSDLRFVAGAAR
jgi:hypothetical protein